MALFGGQTNKHNLASLDNLGMTAAIYPSEDQLWFQGPPINDPGTQGVAPSTGDPSENLALPPAPVSTHDLQATEDYLQQVMNGETPNAAYQEDWVNLTIGGPAGFGNWNEQPYFTGHSQIVQANPGAEQGWGVGPARRWAHYPFSQLDNPARNYRNYLRNGTLDWAFYEQNMLYYRSQLAWEQQWDPYKNRGPVTPVLPVPGSVPHVDTVPTYAGGYTQYTGLDVPAFGLDTGIYGIDGGIY